MTTNRITTFGKAKLRPEKVCPPIANLNMDDVLTIRSPHALKANGGDLSPGYMKSTLRTPGPCARYV